MGTALIIFIAAIFVIAIGTIVYAIIRGIARTASNLGQDTVSLSAQVVSKRTEVSNGTGDMPISTTHYVTFQMADGNRQEFSMSGSAYGLLTEGDQGTLSHRGTWYKGFQRQGCRGRAIAGTNEICLPHALKSALSG